MVSIPHWPQVPLWRIPNKIDLSTSLQLLEALGNPHHKLPPTIHIAGTNGKGSTLAMLKSIFMQGGHKVHSYTSPHLIDFNERVKLANLPISDDHLHSVLERTRLASEKAGLTPSFFEGTTAAAFLAFSETPADLLLLETGLGGRLDCTNVLTNPALTIITSISMDHTEYLGETLQEIANEKAGIIKADVPCVIGPQAPDIYKLLLDKCDSIGAPAFCYEYDYGAEKTGDGFTYLSQKFNLELPLPALKGDHQILNAAGAVAATMLLGEHFKLTKSTISQGLIATNWPGRLHMVSAEQTKQLAGDNIEIYLDGAHNEAGALCLSTWASENLTGPVYLILGMTRNRDAASFCNYFQHFVTKGIAVPVESEPSSCSAEILVKQASKSGIDFTEAESLESALQEISLDNKEKQATIIITGSLFLVSDFLQLETK